MSNIKNPGRITVRGRLMNNAQFQPRENPASGKMQYSALVVLDEGEEKKVMAARDAVVAAKWPKKPKQFADYAVREGDDEDYENSYGKFFINAKSNQPPKLLLKERDGTFRQITPEDNLIYAGVYVYASIDVYPYEANREARSPAGVTTGLRGLMFAKHGEPLGLAVNADDEFGSFDSDLDLEEEDAFPA